MPIRKSAAVLLAAGTALALFAPLDNAAAGAGKSHSQQQAETRWRPTECVDADGRRVLMTLRPTRRMALAARRRDGVPIMVFDPGAMARFHPVTRRWVFFHECAHHQLGHTAGRRPPHREADADCWAVRQMRSRGELDLARIRHIQRDIQGWAGSHVHLPGPQRARHVELCFRDASYRFGQDGQGHGHGMDKHHRDQPGGKGSQPNS